MSYNLSAMEKLLDVVREAEAIVENEIPNDNVARSMENLLRAINESLDERPCRATDRALQILNDTHYMGEQKLRVGDCIIEKTNTGYQLSEDDGRILMADIALYETAYTIASYLHQGYIFNSHPIVNLLHYDNRYAKHVNEARDNQSLFNKYKRDNEFGRMDLMKTKFEENKFRAIQYKSRILMKYNALGK